MEYRYLKDWDVDEGVGHHHAILEWLRYYDPKKEKNVIDFSRYVIEYHDSVRALFNFCTTTSGTYPYAFPMLLLIRHSLEISMKHMIITLYQFERIYFDAINEDVDNKLRDIIGESHKLREIFRSLDAQIISFKKDLSKSNVSVKFSCASDAQDNDISICKKFFERKNISEINLFDLLEELCDFFSEIDPEATAFRYHVTNRIEPNLEKVGGVNIEMLVCYYFQVIEIFKYLYTVEGQLDEFRNA